MIEINNLTSFSVDKNLLKKAAEKILKKEKKVLEISIALVGPAEIKKLNKKYRKNNKITDVLSFLYNGSGEIIICPQEVKESAKKLGIVFKKEFVRVLIHGILHLLGEEHEFSKKRAKKMEAKQEYYLNLFWR
jgi:probable rRNA maturation factor